MVSLHQLKHELVPENNLIFGPLFHFEITFHLYKIVISFKVGYLQNIEDARQRGAVLAEESENH
jgi:hypothetical protein